MTFMHFCQNSITGLSSIYYLVCNHKLYVTEAPAIVELGFSDAPPRGHYSQSNALRGHTWDQNEKHHHSSALK